jgi:hypothetical protein
MSGRCVLLAGAVAACASACLDDGRPFLAFDPQITAQFEPDPDRAVAPGWQKLASEYELHVTRASLELRSVELVGTTKAAASFDPAKPPPGFSLCHSGHCHADDGRLVPYEDVVAEATGMAAPPLLVMGPAAFDLLAPLAQRPPCPNACEAGPGAITRARLTIERLVIEGSVRDGPGVQQPVGSVTFTLNAANAANRPLPQVTVPLALPADNQHEPDVSLALDLRVGAALFDAVVWPSLPVDNGRVDLATNPAAAAALASITERIASIDVRAHTERRTR